MSSLVYYIAQRTFLSSGSQEDTVVILKRELIKELRQHPINPTKGEDFILTQEFMIKLYKILGTYQTIGREIVKEAYFL